MESDLSRYYETLRQIPTLSDKEEKELLKKAKKGDKVAYQKFIASNMRLVISRSLRFCARDDPRIMDLISEGTLGLIRAVDQFDCKRGFRFSTYAVWWVESYIRKAIRFFQKETHATVLNLRKKYKTAETIMTAATGEIPTDEEVADYLKWPSHLLAIYRKYADPRVKISHDPLILEMAASQESAPDTAPVRRDASKAVGKILAKLTTIEEDILRRHYGIGYPEETYKSIADFYGLAKERIRQIENNALRKLFVLLKEKEIPPDLLEKLRGDNVEDPPPED